MIDDRGLGRTEREALERVSAFCDSLRVISLLPNRLVDHEARIFNNRDLGPVPPLPPNILDVLNSECKWSSDGRSVAETHRLTLLPAVVDGRPFTLNALREFSTKMGKGKTPSFHKLTAHYGEDFANTSLEKSVWVLEYEEVALGTLGETDSQQLELLRSFPQYRTATLLEHIGTMVLQDLEHGKRMFPNALGYCEEQIGVPVGDQLRDRRVCAGHFDDRGLSIGTFSGDYKIPLLGRAVVWKF